MSPLSAQIQSMKTSQSNPISSRPVGRRNSDQRGYPKGATKLAVWGCLAKGKPLRTPGDHPSMKTTRSQTIKIRLTPDELTELTLPLEIKSGPKRGLSQLVRTRLFALRKHDSHTYDCRHCRLLASAVNNLNVIARRALDLNRPDTAAQVIAHLTGLER